MGNNRLYIPYILYFLFRFAQYLLEVPTVRMIEVAACHQQLNSVGRGLVSSLLREGDEALCKTPAVQERVSTIVGWKISFDAVPGLFSVFYFGGLADKHGYRMVLTLCCLGYFLALVWLLMTCYFYQVFPVNVAWVSSLFMFIGGGPLVFASVTSSLVANLVEPSSRTTYLFLLAAMPHLGKLLSPAVATYLMAKSTYLPSLISNIILGVCIALLQSLKTPEQVQNSMQDGSDRVHVNIDARDDVTATLDDPDETTGDGAGETTSLVSRIEALSETTTTWQSQSPMLYTYYLAFFLKSNAMASEAFTFQYLSEKFGWPLRKTTILRFALSLGAVLSTLVICPLISSFLVRRGIPTVLVDLGIIRISLLVLTVCFIVTWQATSSMEFILSMLVAGFCEGLEPALQGLVSAVGCKEETGRLFAFMYLCSLLGDMTGGPLMSALMSIGRDSNEVSGGACFLASSIIFALVGLLTFLNWRPERDSVVT